MAPWSIADKIDGILEPGTYAFRVLKVSYTQPKDGGEYGRILMRMKVISEGDHSGETITQGFPLDPGTIGILAAFLHGTGEFDPKARNVPDETEGEELAEFIREHINSKDYEGEYTVNSNKDGTRRFGNVRIVGPFNPAFA